MIPWYISAIPVVFSLIALYYTGNKKWYGFAISLCLQLVWLFYGIKTHQWPFILSPFLYAIMHYRNMRKWQCDSVHTSKYSSIPVHDYVDAETSSFMNADTVAYPKFPHIINGDVVEGSIITNDFNGLNDHDDCSVHHGDIIIAHITGVVDVVYDDTIVLSVSDSCGKRYDITFDTAAKGVSLSKPYNDFTPVSTEESLQTQPGIEIKYISRTD